VGEEVRMKKTVNEIEAWVDTEIETSEKNLNRLRKKLSKDPERIQTIIDIEKEKARQQAFLQFRGANL
jgi:hypothetical protein